MSHTKDQIKIDVLIEIAKVAGKAIMEVYSKSDFKEQTKADNSPVTEADLAAHHVIIDRLNEAYPDIPAFSEESKEVPYSERKNWEQYFLIDPLDGTKEFIKRNDEFTVNIALIKNQTPIWGVVYAPALDVLYYNESATSAFKESEGRKQRLPIPQLDKAGFVMVASRSHMGEDTKAFLEDLKCKYDDVELVNIGSSLKLCLVAEGAADAYPRLGPTSEWDTAAAHAVVRASGGEVYQYASSKALVYNKESLLNPHFEVIRLNKS